MSGEHQPSNIEKAPNIERNNEALEGKYESLKDDLERRAEKSKIENGEQAVERAKIEALKQAVSVEAGGAEKKGKEPVSSPRRHGAISKKEKNANYKRHMKRIQADMPAPQKAFSNFIHAPVVEKTSEVVGSTIARPNAILSGAVVAFIAVLGVYLVAKYYGYPLSGFETIGAFAAGWIIGLLYDFFKNMITGTK